VAIYEKEPSSVIAFALSSREYARELAKRTGQDGGKKRTSTGIKTSEETAVTLLPTESLAVSTNDTSTDVDPVGKYATVLYHYSKTGWLETPPKWNLKDHSYSKGSIQKEQIFLGKCVQYYKLGGI